MLKKTLITLAVGSVMATGVHAAQISEEVIQEAFHPYAKSVPKSDTVKVGMTINASNVDSVKEYLDPAMYMFIKNGDYEMKVGETTSFDLHKSYVDATRQYSGDVVLGEKPGEITGSVAGRPFPAEPAMDDPRAGEKLAWNYKYGYNWGDSSSIYPFYWKYRNMNNGKVERTVKMNFHFLNYR